MMSNADQRKSINNTMIRKHTENKELSSRQSIYEDTFLNPHNTFVTGTNTDQKMVLANIVSETKQSE